MREAPAPDVAIHEYPVHAMPFKRPNNVFVSVPVGIFHPVEPSAEVVYAIWLLVFADTSPTTTQIGDDAPVLYITALLFERTGGIPPPVVVAAVHPVPISSASGRHEILLAGAPDPPPPPPQQIHATPLYPTELIRIPGSTDPPVVIALHPVAPVRSFV